MLLNLYYDCVEFLVSKGAHKIIHSDRTFLDHCIGVARLLDRLECDDETIIAGLLHNCYGNEYYNPNLNITREEIKNIVGVDIENIVYLFVTTKRENIIKQENIKLLMIYLINHFEQIKVDENIKDKVFSIIKKIKQRCEIEYNINFINKNIKLIKEEYKL